VNAAAGPQISKASDVERMAHFMVAKKSCFAVWCCSRGRRYKSEREDDALRQPFRI